MEVRQSRGFEYGVIHLRSERAGFLADILPSSLSCSKEHFLECLAFGAVYLENRRVTRDHEVQVGALLRIHSRPRRFQRKVSWPERILWEDSEFIVVDKPAGLPCHSTVDNLFENVLSQLGKHLGYPIYLTHRLDLPTSGVLVFAKSKEAQSSFNKALSESRVTKIYEALVENPDVPLGSQTHYMEVSPRAPKVVHAMPFSESLRCELEILSKENFGSLTRLRIKLETGRTHQIRAQLSFLGFPIVGDHQYGYESHSTEIKFGERPTGHPAWEEIQLRSIQIQWPLYDWAAPGFLSKTTKSTACPP